MKSQFFKIMLLALLLGIIASHISKAVVVGLDMRILDLKIQQLALKQEIYKSSNGPVLEAYLVEKMELLNMTKDYVDLRMSHPTVSGYVKIGSTEVLVEVTKYMMYSALEYDITKFPIVLVREKILDNPKPIE